MRRIDGVAAVNKAISFREITHWSRMCFGFHRGREDMSHLFFTETALLIPFPKLLILSLCFEAHQSCRDSLRKAHADVQ